MERELTPTIAAHFLEIGKAGKGFRDLPVTMVPEEEVRKHLGLRTPKDPAYNGFSQQGDGNYLLFETAALEERAGIKAPLPPGEKRKFTADQAKQILTDLGTQTDGITRQSDTIFTMTPGYFQTLVGGGVSAQEFNGCYQAGANYMFSTKAIMENAGVSTKGTTISSGRLETLGSLKVASPDHVSL